MWESAKCDDIWCVLEMLLVWSQNHLVGSPQVRVLFLVGRWDVAAEQHRLVHISHSTDMKMNQLLLAPGFPECSPVAASPAISAGCLLWFLAERIPYMIKLQSGTLPRQW